MMVITTTSAAALAAGSALQDVPADQRPAAIPLLAIMVGVVLVGGGRAARPGDPHLPDVRLLSFGMVTGALAIAAIILVQGAGVAEAAPNPGDARPNPDQDIIAQGAGNLASGFLRGMAVGGSVGQTALNVTAGGRTRWAAIWSGLWMLIILQRTERVHGPVRVFEATEIVGESTQAAYLDAEAWLVTPHGE